MPNMMNPGQINYSFSIGKSNFYKKHYPIFESTMLYGLSNTKTIRTSLILSKHYKSVSVGLGINTNLGGIILDVKNSNVLDDKFSTKKTGQSLQLVYQKKLFSTDISFSGDLYTKGYRTFNTYQYNNTNHTTNYIPINHLKKHSFNINFSNIFNSSISFNIKHSKFWNKYHTNTYFTIYYNLTMLNNITFTVSFTKIKNNRFNKFSDYQFMTSINIPLRRNSNTDYNIYNNINISSMKNNVHINNNISGTVGNKINYFAEINSHTLKNNKKSNSYKAIGLNVDLSNTALNIRYSYDRPNNKKYINFGLSGSFLVHRNGITFGKHIGETFALIEVLGVKGLSLYGLNNAKTNSYGYLIMPYITPYRPNLVTLETNNILSSKIELLESSKIIIPRYGEIPKVKFFTKSGRRVQFKIFLQNGEKIPFGASIIKNNKYVGIVDTLSQVLLFGIEDKGNFLVKWNQNKCIVHYKLKKFNKDIVYDRIKVMCKKY